MAASILDIRTEVSRTILLGEVNADIRGKVRSRLSHTTLEIFRSAMNSREMDRVERKFREILVDWKIEPQGIDLLVSHVFTGAIRMCMNFGNSLEASKKIEVLLKSICHPGGDRNVESRSFEIILPFEVFRWALEQIDLATQISVHKNNGIIVICREMLSSLMRCEVLAFEQGKTPTDFERANQDLLEEVLLLQTMLPVAYRDIRQIFRTIIQVAKEPVRAEALCSAFGKLSAHIRKSPRDLHLLLEDFFTLFEGGRSELVMILHIVIQQMASRLFEKSPVAPQLFEKLGQLIQKELDSSPVDPRNARVFLEWAMKFGKSSDLERAIRKGAFLHISREEWFFLLNKVGKEKAVRFLALYEGGEAFLLESIDSFPPAERQTIYQNCLQLAVENRNSRAVLALVRSRLFSEVSREGLLRLYRLAENSPEIQGMLITKERAEAWARFKKGVPRIGVQRFYAIFRELALHSSGPILPGHPLTVFNRSPQIPAELNRFLDLLRSLIQMGRVEVVRELLKVRRHRGIVEELRILAASCPRILALLG